MKKKRRSKNDYVNNKEFLQKITEYKEKLREAERKDLDTPRVPNYIGECLMDIANGLARRPNFYNYPFKEEMIGDGIENSLRAIDNFDPEKSQNPFAYFTQIIYFAFVRRINAEKKQMYVSMKSMERDLVEMSLAEGASFDSTDASYHLVKDDYASDFVKSYEKALEEKKMKKKKG